MTVRLTHRQKPDAQQYIFQALGRSFDLTGLAATLRKGLNMSIPDKIPYIYTGYSASVSKLPPVWGTMSAYSITEGVAVSAQTLPVTVPNGGGPTITVAWHSSSVPSTKPAWVTLTSGAVPTIAFTGTQVDANDVTSMVISATANGQTALSTGVAITVTAGDPTWTQTTLSIPINTGSTTSVDLSPYLTNYNPTLHQLDVTSGTLPTGISIDSTNSEIDVAGTQVLNDNRTVTLHISDKATADWITRSTATGVVYANALDSTITVDTGTNLPPTNTVVTGTTFTSKVSLDTSVKPSGQTGSMKITVLNTDGADSGSARVYFGATRTFGNGDTFWWSFRVYATEELVWQRWAGANSDTGHKLSIMSYFAGSNQVNEIVCQGAYHADIFSTYWQDGQSTAIFPWTSAVTSCSPTDLLMTPGIDLGANTLTGTNPDTGSAWTACEQSRRQYGQLYSAFSAPDYRGGFGDYLCSGARHLPREWYTLTFRAVIGTLGTFTNRITGWYARENQAYVKFFDAQNARLGAGPNWNCLWLLPYMTNRTSGGRRITSRTSNITGITLYTVGNSTPVGNGTLSWNATTQRLTWQGFGESTGTAVGFSSANGVTTRNVCSGTTTDSYVVAKLTGTPPVTNQTDTVTIADGRADTQINYSEVIISTLPINAPGGYAPT